MLSWILAARRATACLGYTLRELGACTGLCGRTVQAHVASLRAKGLVEREGLRATPDALTGRGERHARVDVRDLMAQPTGAAWLLHLFRRLHSDRSGRLRVSRRYLAERMDRSTRAVRDGFAKLRALGIETPGRRLSLGVEKTFRSTRRKLADVMKKASATQEGQVSKGLRTEGKSPNSEAEPPRRGRS